MLTTLSGEEVQVVIDLQEFDRLDEFETAVLEQLPTIGGYSTFVNKDTGEILANPIWDTLRDCNCFNLVVRKCFSQAEHKGQLKKRAKAIRVPPISAGRVLPHAFTHTVDVRHVQVEAGIHTIGEALVQLPSTVVCLQDGAFRRNYVLRTVIATGRKEFGSGCLKNATP